MSVLPIPAPALAHHSQTLFTAMKEWRAQKRVPPVLLITGLPGVGKRSMCYFLAQWILCERNGINSAEDEGPGLFGDAPAAAPVEGDPVPCGECSNCQKALKGSWVDFTEITPEEEDGALKIEQFRKLKASVGFGAHEGLYKVILIPQAERMTVQAANSVLKLLEEPPRGWIFFLTAADATLLLPTIVSRCQTLRLKPMPEKTLEELLTLAQVDAAKIKPAAMLAQGSWTRAMEWADPEHWDNRKRVIEFLKDPVPALNGLVEWATQEPSNFDRMLDQLENLVAELIRWSVAQPAVSPEKYAWKNTDASGLLATLARRETRAQWIEHAERLAKARQELNLPINRKLLAQSLLLPLLPSAIR